MFCVYRFLDKNNKILYVGKTTNLKKRLELHYITNYLPKEIYQKIKKIEYAEVKDKMTMDLLESDLISKYKPKNNIRLKDDEISIVYYSVIDKLKWQQYSMSIKFYKYIY